MKPKYMSYILSGLAVLVFFAIVAAVRVDQSRNNIDPEGNNPEATEQNTENNQASEQNQEQNNAQESTQVQNPESFEGVLEISDNPEKGNFKLVSGEREVYLFTQKNYYHLIGQEVKVLINGNLESFELVDIIAK